MNEYIRLEGADLYNAELVSYSELKQLIGDTKLRFNSSKLSKSGPAKTQLRDRFKLDKQGYFTFRVNDRMTGQTIDLTDYQYQTPFVKNKMLILVTKQLKYDGKAIIDLIKRIAPTLTTEDNSEKRIKYVDEAIKWQNAVTRQHDAEKKATKAMKAKKKAMKKE